MYNFVFLVLILSAASCVFERLAGGL